MGKGGSFSGLKPPTKLISRLYNQGKSVDDDGNRIDGICKYCNEWDAELVDGGCRDKDCKLERLTKKVESGEAIRFQTDVIGSNGKVGTLFEKDGKKFFVEKSNAK